MDQALANVNRVVSDSISEEKLDSLLDDLFTYHPWDEQQRLAGDNVRDALKAAYKAVLLNVPSSPTRTRALNGIVDIRMLANAAITFEGIL